MSATLASLDMWLLEDVARATDDVGRHSLRLVARAFADALDRIIDTSAVVELAEGVDLLWRFPRGATCRKLRLRMVDARAALGDLDVGDINRSRLASVVDLEVAAPQGRSLRLVEDLTMASHFLVRLRRICITTDVPDPGLLRNLLAVLPTSADDDDGDDRRVVLEDLEISGPAGNGSVELDVCAAAARQLSRLRRLNLGSASFEHWDALLRLLPVSALAQLRELRCRVVRAPPRIDVRHHLPTLRRLTLELVPVTSSPIADASGDDTIQLELPSSLRTLRVGARSGATVGVDYAGGGWPGHSAVSAWTGDAGATRLEYMGGDGCGLAGSTLPLCESLFSRDNATHVRSLGLQWLTLGRAGAPLLPARMPALRRLRLRQCQLSDETLCRLRTAELREDCVLELREVTISCTRGGVVPFDQTLDALLHPATRLTREASANKNDFVVRFLLSWHTRAGTCAHAEFDAQLIQPLIRRLQLRRRICSASPATESWRLFAD